MLNSRDAWREIDSQFVLKHYADFEDYNFVYHLQEFVEGGTDLNIYSILHDYKKLPEDDCKFYIASILLAFEEAHSKRIAIRNLNVSQLACQKTLLT